MQLTGLNPGLLPAARAALQLAEQYGLKVQITSVYRTLAEQAMLRGRYEKCLARGEVGKTAACRYPANRPGDSGHNWGLAWDSWVPAEQMPLWKAIREYYGWRVPENDLVHAELPEWRDYVRIA
jgi:LAS superfamily LD-carboxypeptidase LdcB